MTPDDVFATDWDLHGRVQYIGGFCGIEWTEPEPLDTHQATWLHSIVERAAERLDEAAGRPEEPRAKCTGHERRPRRKACPHKNCRACDECCRCGGKILLPHGAGDRPNRSPGTSCPDCPPPSEYPE